MEPEFMAVGDLVDYAPPLCFTESSTLPWQMTRAERFCFLELIRRFKPEVAIEVGTSWGGSLEVLSRHSGEVYSIDIDPSVAESLKGRFPNVTFLSGDSSILLPKLVDDVNASDKKVGVVLIDGDHSEQGVRRDINAILKIVPRTPVGIIMHDSFNPACRRGITTAEWEASPYVHYVEIDFVGGIFVPDRTSVESSLVSGLAFALLLPEQRKKTLKILESQRHHFEIVRRFAAKSGFTRSSLVSRIWELFGRLVSRGSERS